ncbi:MAG: DUF4255 domain-containing protein [Candidatus Nanopelagicales bacterium]|jgi:hypothetical protein
MFADVDRAVAALLETEKIAGQAPKVSFEAPKRDWAAQQTAPVLNLFLADIREDLSRRSTTLIEEVNDDGFVVSRQQPYRFFNVTYALTAWASRPADDHHLLGLALSALVKYDYIPAEFCQGELLALVESGHQLHLRAGGKIFSDRFATELWPALGTDYHPILPVVVSLPVAAGIPEAAGPPQTVPPKITVSDTGSGLTDSVEGRDPKDPEKGIRTRRRSPQS